MLQYADPAPAAGTSSVTGSQTAGFTSGSLQRTLPPHSEVISILTLVFTSLCSLL